MITSATIKMKDEEFAELADIIYKNAGITFTINKKYLLENRLTKRLNELNFTTFKDYIYFLKYDVKRREEMKVLMNLVTINETYFLRERAQMDHMIKKAIPEMTMKGKRSFKIWSAACSSGEEPYSIAMLLNEEGMYGKYNIEIFATDINTEVIGIAEKGVYRSVSFRGVPPSIIDKYFLKTGLDFVIKPEIKGKVKFFQANLLESLAASKIGAVDFIFCRNVLIYFDVDAKKKVVDIFYKTLNVGGHLYLGHSETLSKIDERFKMVNFGTGIVYVK
ncbi:MAG: protein-glutamate O-methyltransferase CheR [Calditerrivibrio sp.]|nr:protein-glutamate O-methyltransferase CheR [Calditerrivibrio sp.]